MRPTIIRDAAMAAQLTRSKYTTLRDSQLAAKEKGLLFMSDKRSPLLPPIDDVLAVPPSLRPDSEDSLPAAGAE